MKKRYFIIIVVILLIIFAIVVPLFRYFDTVHNLKEQGVYQLVATPPETIDGVTSQSTYFMVCEPSSDDAELAKQIETFIEKNNIVAQLEKELTETWGGSPKDTVLKIVFVEPNTPYPIGKFPKEDTTFDDRFVKKIATYRYLDRACIHKFIVPYR